MERRQLPRRHVVAYASADDFAEGTISILGRLGYEIVSPEKFEKLVEAGDVPAKPDLFIVEERRMQELPAGEVPVVALARRDQGGYPQDRIAAAMKPPVGMHDLYRVVQQILEDQPRASLRASTRLEAVCRRSGHEWNARVISLSEAGCLLESPEAVPLGTDLQLAFELPGVGTAHVRAEITYQLQTSLGLVFSPLSPQIRTAIVEYVTRLLLEDEAQRSR